MRRRDTMFWLSAGSFALVILAAGRLLRARLRGGQTGDAITSAGRNLSGQEQRSAVHDEHHASKRALSART